MYVCICNAVTEKQVRQAAQNGARTLKDLQTGLGVATGCGQCAGDACRVLSCPADGGNTITSTPPQPGASAAI